MLKYIEITNFKSFKNHTTISFAKTNYKTLSSTNLNCDILKGLMFVGANASGKSNFVKVFSFAKNCVNKTFVPGGSDSRASQYAEYKNS